MAKISKKNQNPKKSSNSNMLSICNYSKSLIDTKVFTKKISIKNLVIYSLLYLFLVVIISSIKTIKIDNTSIFSSILYSLFGIPLIFLIFYGLLYIFLNSFENSRKPFMESFLVFFSLIIPFVLIGNFLTLISTFFLFGFFNNFLSILIVINILYLLINATIGFKNYYKTSIFKLITSIILVEIFFGVLALVQYLSILINSN